MPLSSKVVLLASIAWWNVASSDPVACPPLPTAVTNLQYLGAGHCANAQGLTTMAYSCNATYSEQCALLGDVDACAAQCLLDDGCTGFELRSVASGTLPFQCFIMFQQVPLPTEGIVWTVGDNGTQLPTSSRVTAVTTDASGDTCCYRRAYPRPCPVDMATAAPPKQSARTQAIFADMSAKAAAASAAVVPALEEFIAFCAANGTTTEPGGLFGVAACPGLADLTNNGTTAPYPSADQIVARFSEEALAMEYTHGYAPLWDAWGCQPGVCLADETRLFSLSFPYIPNLYQPLTLGLNGTPVGTAARFDPVIQNIFGCDPFKDGATFTYDFLEAANRITYAASNYVRGPVGNIIAEVGAFDAVMRPSYIRDMALITPWDSWHYEAQFPNCVSWPNCTAGTLDSQLHILYAWMTGGGPTGTSYPTTPTAATCAAQTAYLRYAVCSLPPTRNNPVGAATIPSYYFEVDPLGQLNYPDGVKIITASYSDYFGTWMGSLIRQWCKEWKWALAWVLHNTGAPLDARRLLDPTVLASSTVNMTAAGLALAPQFEAMWTAANASRATPVNFTDYAAVWANFTNVTVTPAVGDLLTWNIGARECADFDNCFGISHSTGTCVCYINRTDTMGKKPK